MKILFLLVLPFSLCFSCSTARRQAAAKDDGRIEVNFVQVNDVYEIAPLSGGREGGVARIASLKKKYLQQNKNSFLVMAGDFLSPSVYHSLQFEGKAIRGRQMVEALNAAGLDLACFGNHEFDIREQELQDRINESAFQWIASNSFQLVKNQTKPFTKNGAPIPKAFIMQLQDADGTKARIGFIGICIPFNRAGYVSYSDPLASAKEAYAQLKDSVDAVVAITHQFMQEDEQLARELPGLAAILGGHEHDQRSARVGKVTITKSMANAKTAFIVKLTIDKNKGTVESNPLLEQLNESVPLDSATSVVVNKWVDIAEKNYSSLGFDARKIVRSTGEPLDGREVVIRREPTGLTRLVAEAMAAACPLSSLALLNSGSVRVDDILQMPLTQYDIIRTLPFGGSVREVDMKGSLLVKVLEQGLANKGNGGYLVHNGTAERKAEGLWLLKGSPVEPGNVYRVALSDFLLSGKEANLEFLNPSNPGIVKLHETPSGTSNPASDVRLAVISYLEKQGR
ncbi:MAG TPA: bifunctional metallophosphatase/5'-nucleotidase [Flavisolibacter sp.]|nr:bifunctional metallophosphatase/5'-nucleotidase [Flavisolibacter sp.]